MKLVNKPHPQGIEDPRILFDVLSGPTDVDKRPTICEFCAHSKPCPMENRLGPVVAGDFLPAGGCDDFALSMPVEVAERAILEKFTQE